MKLVRQIVSYGLVGVTNGAVTAGTIAILTLIGFGPITANFAGYVTGLMSSFFLNSKFTFENGGSPFRFLLSFSIAYLLNLAALLLSKPLTSISPLIPQMIGVFTYVVAFFLLMKIWVYRSD